MGLLKKMMAKHRDEGLSADEALEMARREARRHAVLMRYYHNFDIDDDDKMAAKIVQPPPGSVMVDQWQLTRKKRREEWEQRELERKKEAEKEHDRRWRGSEGYGEVMLAEMDHDVDSANDDEGGSSGEDNETTLSGGGFRRPVAMQGNTLLFGNRQGTVHKFVVGPRDLSGEQVVKWFRGYGKFEGTVLRREKVAQPEFYEGEGEDEVAQEHNWIVKFTDGKEYVETESGVRKMWKAWMLDKTLGNRRDSAELMLTQVTTAECDPVEL